MFRFSKSILILAFGVATSVAFAFDGYKGIGRQATAAEVKAWDIDVRPDFKGLPQGSGDVQRGNDLFEIGRAHV